MRDERDDDFEQLLKVVDYGARLAAARAIASHKRAGNSVAWWRDGKVVWVPPDEIPDVTDPLIGPIGPDGQPTNPQNVPRLRRAAPVDTPS